MPNYDYHNTITIKSLISRCITILSAFLNQRNFIDLIKTGLPVKIPKVNAQILALPF